MATLAHWSETRGAALWAIHPMTAIVTTDVNAARRCFMQRDAHPPHQVFRVFRTLQVGIPQAMQLDILALRHRPDVLRRWPLACFGRLPRSRNDQSIFFAANCWPFCHAFGDTAL